MSDDFVVPPPLPDPEEDREVGSNVARLRKARGLSQSALAAAMVKAGQGHWRQNTVSRVETGKQELDVHEAEALADILDGNIFEGTALGRSMQQTFERLARLVLIGQLHQAEGELRSALEAMREATAAAEGALKRVEVVQKHMREAGQREDARDGQHPEEA